MVESVVCYINERGYKAYCIQKDKSILCIDCIFNPFLNNTIPEDRILHDTILKSLDIEETITKNSEGFIE